MDRRRFLGLFGRRMTAALSFAPLLPLPSTGVDLDEIFRLMHEIVADRKARYGSVENCMIQRLSQAQIEMLFRGNGPGFETTDGSDPLAPLRAYR